MTLGNDRFEGGRVIGCDGLLVRMRPEVNVEPALLVIVTLNPSEMDAPHRRVWREIGDDE
jgi:hypothetical protein